MDTLLKMMKLKIIVFDSANENKETLKNYTTLWEETREQIEAINNGDPIRYIKDFMKIRFEGWWFAFG